MEKTNLIIVMSDEHAGRYAGCYGHPIVKTPNIDALARRGTLFSNAYTNSPICMPARSAFATGLYPHQTHYWCNAHPYDGRILSWGHALQRSGVPVTSIGKLHYRDEHVSSGFDSSILPMYAPNGGVGDLFGAIRQHSPLPPRYGVKQVADEVGAGESAYTRYDRAITAEAVKWLEETAPALSEPWVLYVSFVAPHFPLIAPQEFYDLYPANEMPLPKACRPEDWPRHPWFEEFRRAYITDSFFDDDLRRKATAAYFGLCSFVDANLGKVMDTLAASSFAGRTRLVYMSDHGDNLGVRGLWQKSNFYQESAHVPMVMAGPGIPENTVEAAPVSLIDFYPTILDCTGAEEIPEDGLMRDGVSLLRLLSGETPKDREVFGEYHAAGAVNGAYMLRRSPWKYIHYANMPPQLFNLEDDPEELTDLAVDPGYAAILAGFEASLRCRLDPEAVDAAAKADQLVVLEKHGGPQAILAKGSMGASPPPDTQPRPNEVR